jgi:hypothetical protein
MKAYITLGNMRKSTPIEFTGKLVKQVGSYFEPFTNQHQRIWETDQEFTFHINGRDIQVKTLTVYE